MDLVYCLQQRGKENLRDTGDISSSFFFNFTQGNYQGKFFILKYVR